MGSPQASQYQGPVTGIIKPPLAEPGSLTGGPDNTVAEHQPPSPPRASAAGPNTSRLVAQQHVLLGPSPPDRGRRLTRTVNGLSNVLQVPGLGAADGYWPGPGTPTTWSSSRSNSGPW